MLKTLFESLTPEQRAKLHKDWGIKPQTITNWKAGDQWPTRYQTVALAEVTGIDRHKLDDAIALEQAKPEQRKLLERVLGKARGVVAGLLVLAAGAGVAGVELGSKAMGPFRFKKKIDNVRKGKSADASSRRA